MSDALHHYEDYLRKTEELWDKTEILGIILHDSRATHRTLAEFIAGNLGWLDELAVQADIYILFPQRSEGSGRRNPSAKIAADFKLGIDRLPGVVLLATGKKDETPASRHFIYVPLEQDEIADSARIENALTELFTIVQEALGSGITGHEALVEIKANLSKRRRNRTNSALAASFRKGAQIVLIRIPETFLKAIAEGFGKAFGTNLGS